MNDFPLLVEFVSGTTLYREPETIPKLPIVQNGPPEVPQLFVELLLEWARPPQVASDMGGRPSYGAGLILGSLSSPAVEPAAFREDVNGGAIGAVKLGEAIIGHVARAVLVRDNPNEGRAVQSICWGPQTIAHHEQSERGVRPQSSDLLFLNFAAAGETFSASRARQATRLGVRPQQGREGQGCANDPAVEGPQGGCARVRSNVELNSAAWPSMRLPRRRQNPKLFSPG